jgi:hypothetical protein
MVINLDCVGAGEKLALFSASKGTQAKTFWESALKESKQEFISKQSSVAFVSDHLIFKNSVMFARVSKSKLGFIYLPNAHTSKDIKSDIPKIEVLSKLIYNSLKGREANEQPD